MKEYKYLIINKESGEGITKKNCRELSDFIRIIYPDKMLSHTTVSKRLKENDKKYFEYFDLIIKELIW
jgi:hypothetical protein